MWNYILVFFDKSDVDFLHFSLFWNTFSIWSFLLIRMIESGELTGLVERHLFNFGLFRSTHTLSSPRACSKFGNTRGTQAPPSVQISDLGKTRGGASVIGWSNHITKKDQNMRNSHQIFRFSNSIVWDPFCVQIWAPQLLQTAEKSSSKVDWCCSELSFSNFGHEPKMSAEHREFKNRSSDF